MEKGATIQGIEDEVQKGRDQGSGVSTHGQRREAWKTAGSYGVTEMGSSSTNTSTVTVRVLGYCWERPIVL